MSDLDAYTKLQNELEEVSNDINRREGVVMRITEELKSEFGVTSISAAKSLLKKLKKEVDQVRSEIEIENDKFQERWGKFLETID